MAVNFEQMKKILDAYAAALVKRDFIECVKLIGVLEYLGNPDVDHYMGFAYHVNGDFDKAIECFLKVHPESQMYKQTLQSLAIDYMYLGDYLELDATLKQSMQEYTPLEELDIRIKCLEHMDIHYFMEHESELCKIELRNVEVKKYLGQDAEMFFGICRAFSYALVITGECINQILTYFMRNESVSINSVEQNDDIRRYIVEYQKWCYILQYSKYLCHFRLPEGMESLAACALYDKTWEEKLKIFKSTNHVSQIIQIILTMCRPENHVGVERHTAVESILEAYIRINPRALAQVVSYYFDIVKSAYIKRNSSIAQYLGYVYSEILVSERDPFELKKRIEEIRRCDDDYDFEKVAADIAMARKMSVKGHAALLNAESTFRKIDGTITGANDFSALSLQFFRIIEIEYSEKLLLPLSKSIDIEHMYKLAGEADEEWKQKKWNKDCQYLEKITKGKQESFEIGAIRTMLAHVNNKKMKNDSCAIYLKSCVDKFLTVDGKRAWQNWDMINIIEDSILKKYRIPGAHTGMLPYSVALESRKYVLDKLPDIISWFK